AWNRMVFIGSAGGEYGIRVSVTAYSQADGKQVWRWWATNSGQGVLREPRQLRDRYPGIDRYHRSIDSAPYSCCDCVRVLRIAADGGRSMRLRRLWNW
ncbi:MAG TPA: hypothetical protein VN325_45935, partial [Steroidobacteraceae bacterium]|nr:hypothetical protein [Steroidobacteraceae bacterium]